MAPEPDPPLLDFQAKSPPEVHNYHHGFSFLVNLPNIGIETVKDRSSLMQLGVKRPLLRLGAEPPQA